LNEEDKNFLGSTSQVVLLSRQSLDTHKESHSDVGIDEYRLIPKILENGEVWQKQNEAERIMFMSFGTKTYRAVIKRTADCSKNYFLSLFVNTKGKAPKGAVRIR
jgi:hypothetical protein